MIPNPGQLAAPASVEGVIRHEHHCTCGWGLTVEGPDRSPQRRQMVRMLVRFLEEHSGLGHRVFDSREAARAAREGRG